MANRKLSFWDMFNLSFGFFGVQIAYALQSANISRIFATLGADPHQLSFFWILPPLMGMIVQPLIGKYSDKTWNRMGRRKPYLLIGAIIAVLVMILLPNAGSLGLSTSYVLLGLNSAMWFGLFALIFLDTSINVAMQPFKMMVGDMVTEEQKTQAYSIQSFLCNAGQLVGCLAPFLLTSIGVANEAPEGVIPDSVIYSFYAGAAILILCVIYTFAKVKEMPPKEYAEFHGIDPDAKKEEGGGNLFKLLVKAPKTFWQVGLVQFFCWAAFLYMWNYSPGSIAANCWNTTDTTSPEYQDAGNWVGVVFACQAVGAVLWALVLPKFKTVKFGYIVSLLIGAIGFISLLFIKGDYSLILAGYDDGQLAIAGAPMLVIQSRYVICVSYLLIGCAWAAMLAYPFTLLTNALEGNPYMGSYLGLFNCTICLPQIVAAATGGVVLHLLGSAQPRMMLMAGIFLVAAACCVPLVKTKKSTN